MATRSRSPSVDSGSIKQPILRDFRIPADAKNLLQNSYMQGHLVVLWATNLWQNIATEAPRDVAPTAPVEEIKDEPEMSEDEYTPAS